MARIPDALVDLNTWWRGEFTVEYRDREVYREIQRFTAVPQMVRDR